MNTSHLEHVAESLIVHELMRNGLFVAKPLSDILGADLIAFADFSDAVRFCRIQCKGRSLENSKSHVEIPAEYVGTPFMVALYLVLGQGVGQLFCFFSTDIRNWKRNAKGNFVLRLTRKGVEGPLQSYRFNDAKMSLLRKLIQVASDTGTFHGAVYGVMNATIALPGGET